MAVEGGLFILFPGGPQVQTPLIFAQIGREVELPNELRDGLTCFVCHWYGFEESSDINAVPNCFHACRRSWKMNAFCEKTAGRSSGNFLDLN